MSTNMDVETGKMRVYDDDGRTYLPDDIMDALGAKRGDEIKLVYEDGNLQGRLIKESDDR